MDWQILALAIGGPVLSALMGCGVTWLFLRDRYETRLDAETEAIWAEAVYWVRQQQPDATAVDLPPVPPLAPAGRHERQARPGVSITAPSAPGHSAATPGPERGTGGAWEAVTLPRVRQRCSLIWAHLNMARRA